MPPVLVVGGSFATLGAGRSLTPGFDTPYNILRARAVAQDGLRGLGRLPSGINARRERVGYPTLAAFLATGTRAEPRVLLLALPALMAVVIGLAAGAFARYGLDQPRWAFPVYATVVGSSVAIALTSIGHADNLVADGALMGVAATAVLAPVSPLAGVAAAMLLAAAALAHWPFAGLFVAVLLGAAALSAPGSLAAWRKGRDAPPRSRGRARLVGTTPSGRLARLAVVAGILGAIAVVLTRSPLKVPATGLPHEVFRGRLAEDLPAYAFVVLGPLAAVGAATLLWSRATRWRPAASILLTWAAGAGIAVGVAAYFRIPAHRILAFALAIPFLAAAAVVAGAAAASRTAGRILGTALASAVVVAAIAGALVTARAAWFDRAETALDAEELSQLRTAAEYLAQVEGRVPVVFVANVRGPRSAFRHMPFALPVRVLPRTFVYMGTPQLLLDGKPTLRPGNPGFNESSLERWRKVRKVVDDDPVILELSAFSEIEPDHPGREIAPGVLLVQGPEPTSPVGTEPPPAPASGPEVALLALACLALVGAVGSGWAAALLPPGWLERVALAPSLGIGVLLLGGVLAALARLDGRGPRPFLMAGLAALGWAAAAGRMFRDRRAQRAAEI